jgi:hypothetical protein
MSRGADGHGERRAGENPFSTSFVRPGAIAYQFANGESAASLVDRFLATGRRGQIVGPHGVGKSTLLKLLRDELAARAEVVTQFELHDDQRSLTKPVELAPRSIIVVDGYEQLSFASRIELAWSVRSKACGLLVTTHRAVWFPVRLPVLAELRPSVDVAVQLVASLLAQHGLASTAGGISPAVIERIFFEVGGDMRELFFRLYDLYESQRS